MFVSQWNYRYIYYRRPFVEPFWSTTTASYIKMSLSFDLISTAYSWGLLLLAAASLTLFTKAAGKYLEVHCAGRAEINSSNSQYYQEAPRPRQQPFRQGSKGSAGNPEDAYYNIKPLENFNIDAEEPIKARPFKPKFHMTMGTCKPTS